MAKAPSILDDDHHPDTPTCDQLGKLIDIIGIRHLCVALAVVSHIKAAECEAAEPLLALEWEQWAACFEDLAKKPGLR
jgi:hypothetical protein